MQNAWAPAETSVRPAAGPGEAREWPHCPRPARRPPVTLCRGAGGSLGPAHGAAGRKQTPRDHVPCSRCTCARVPAACVTVAHA